MTRALFDRAAHARALGAALADPAALHGLHDGPPDFPAPVTQWLGRLLLLEGVPFDYLIADDDLLVRESIRFFTVDPSWQAALLDGACSVGRMGPGDAAHDGAFLFTPGGLLDQARAAAGITAPAVTGFLLRSAAVSGWWPGIRVEGYADTGATQRLTALRTDLLAPTLLLVLFDGTLRRLDLHEPPEGLHFGLDGPDDVDGSLLHRTLRYLGAAEGHAAGAPMADVEANRFIVQKDAKDTTYVRAGGVVQIDRLAGAIQQALLRVGATTADGPFTSAEFALEMVEGVDFVTFTAKAPAR